MIRAGGLRPLSGDDLELHLTIEHYVGREKRNYPQEPWPIVVDVIPKPGFWERLDAFLEHATGTANLATGLAKALGALFAAIAGWAVWSWRKSLWASLRVSRARGAPAP